MAKVQFTLFTTGAPVLLAGLAVLTPPPVIVKALARLARAALSSADTVAPLEAVADTRERLTVEVFVRSRSTKVIEPVSRSWLPEALRVSAALTRAWVLSALPDRLLVLAVRVKGRPAVLELIETWPAVAVAVSRSPRFGLALMASRSLAATLAWVMLLSPPSRSATSTV